MSISVLAYLLLALWSTSASEKTYKVLLWPLGTENGNRLESMITMADILKESKFEVYLLTNNLADYPRSKNNYKTIVYSAPEAMKSDIKMVADIELSFIDWSSSLVHLCAQMLNDSSVMDAVKQENFDLIIYDINDHCAALYKDALGLTAIQWSDSHPSFYKDVFFPSVPSHVCTEGSSWCTPKGMNYWQRMRNLLDLTYINYWVIPNWMDQFEQLRYRYIPESQLSVHSTHHRTVTMVMMDFVVDFTRPLMPHIFTVPYLFQNNPQDLRVDVQKYLDKLKTDVIYINYKEVDAIAPGLVEKYLKAFEKIPYKVICGNTEFKNVALPQNVMVYDGIPEEDILANKKVKLFISNVATSSMYNAIYSSKPVIATPMFGTQIINAKKLVYKTEMAVEVDIMNINEDDIIKTINQVISDKRFEQKAKLAHNIVSDTITPPKENFIWLVKYIIEDDGAANLISKAVFKLNLFQYLMVDIVLTISIFFLFIFLITYIIFRNCAKLFRHPKTKKD